MGCSALRIFDSIEHSLMSAHVQANLVAVEAQAARLTGESETALHLYQEALERIEQGGEPNGCSKADRIAFMRKNIALLQAALSATAPARAPSMGSTLAQPPGLCLPARQRRAASAAGGTGGDPEAGPSGAEVGGDGRNAGGGRRAEGRGSYTRATCASPGR